MVGFACAATAAWPCGEPALCPELPDCAELCEPVCESACDVPLSACPFTLVASDAAALMAPFDVPFEPAVDAAEACTAVPVAATVPKD
jgi:hypothetical protein